MPRHPHSCEEAPAFTPGRNRMPLCGTERRRLWSVGAERPDGYPAEPGNANARASDRWLG